MCKVKFQCRGLFSILRIISIFILLKQQKNISVKLNINDNKENQKKYMQRQTSNLRHKADIISLQNWPNKPIRQPQIRLSPISSQILASLNISPNQILPVSVTDYLGLELLNEQNMDELVGKYNQFNQQRLQKIDRLKKQRANYQNIEQTQKANKIHSIYNNQYQNQNQYFSLKNLSQEPQAISLKARNTHQDKKRKSFIISTDRNNKPRNNLPIRFLARVHTINDAHCLEQINESPQKKYLIKPNSISHSTFLPYKRSNTSEEQDKILSSYKSNKAHLMNKIFKKDKKTQGVIRNKLKDKESQKQKQTLNHNYMEHYLGKNNKNSNKIYYYSGGRSKKSIKHSKTSRDNCQEYYGNTPNEKIRFTEKKLNKKGISSNHLIGSPIKQKKTMKKDRLTQKPNSILPMHEYYYDSTSTRLINNHNIVLESNLYVVPLLDQLTGAVDELIQMTRTQQIQLQMMQNLSSSNQEYSDRLQQKQKRRLMKIHNIEKDQLKNHINALKQKIKLLKSTGITGMVNTL